MISTSSHSTQKTRITNLVMIVVWLYSSTAVFFSPLNAQAQAAATESDEIVHSPEIGHSPDKAHSPRSTGHKTHPCHNKLQSADNMHQAPPVGEAIDCESKCATTGCGNCVSGLLPQSLTNAALKNVMHSPFTLQSLPDLLPDSIYRPPLSSS